jgi:guanine deaminase
VTLYRATVVDTPGNPFIGAVTDALAADVDGGVLVRDGIIVARGSYASVRSEYPDDQVVELDGGLLVPGFVDTHVHYPQIRAIGGLGLPLLDWLDRCALPEECRLGESSYAQATATEFLDGIVAAGTTTALVFGSHFPAAMDIFFATAERSGLNITAGLVVSDRLLPDALLSSPERARVESHGLIERWHARGRLRYAVTPRFSLSASDEMLATCAELMADGIWFTSHINENRAEVTRVSELFTDARDYLDTYDRHGLVTNHSVYAHNVHPSDRELSRMGEAGAWTAHCPTSNSALGSGLFPLSRHVGHGVGVSLGSDIGAGTGLFLPKEGLQAYFMQQLLGEQGLALTPVHLLYLATRAGALALGLGDRIGDFAIGKEFDAVWLRPAPGSTLAINLEHAVDANDALARVFALASTADVAGVWVRGHQVLPAPIGERASGGAADAVSGPGGFGGVRAALATRPAGSSERVGLA